MLRAYGLLHSHLAVPQPQKQFVVAGWSNCAKMCVCLGKLKSLYNTRPTWQSNGAGALCVVVLHGLSGFNKRSNVVAI